MEALIQQHRNTLQRFKSTFSRELMEEIPWSEQLIGIKGARGVGKTTMLLQYIKQKFGNSSECLYVSLDNIYFAENTLLSLVEQFATTGGKLLVLDEVHKYASWSQELKNSYDIYPELQIIFTSSSLLHIHKGNADLSRRALVYDMEGLSFREYLEIETKQKFKKYTLEEILEHHADITGDIVSKIRPLAHFMPYLQHGFYPFYLQSKDTYNIKLLNTINLMLEIDMPYIHNIEIRYMAKLKKLLSVLANSVPFDPNITRLAAAIELTRPTVLTYLEYLRDAKMINLLKSKSKSYEHMAKPDKLYLHNTNLMYAISPKTADLGALRETFFYNQLAYKHVVHSSAVADFTINEQYTFEVGGQSKRKPTGQTDKNYFTAVDGIEHGFNNRIPLWLFGFLY